MVHGFVFERAGAAAADDKEVGDGGVWCALSADAFQAFTDRPGGGTGHHLTCFLTVARPVTFSFQYTGLT